MTDEGPDGSPSSSVTVLLNRLSGTLARGEVAPADVERAFAAAGCRATVRSLRPDAMGAAIEAFAQAHGDDPDAILAIGGGDGSLGQAAAALSGRAAALAVLPLGTFNNFARDLGLPLDIDEAVAVIAKGFRRRIDLGEVNGRVFVNNSSIGFYPFLVSQREALRRRHGVSKLLATIPALWRGFRDTGWRLLTITATLDARPVRTPCLFVGNNVYDLENFGRRQHLDRGELGVCVIRGRSRLRMLRLPLLALGRKLDDADEVDRFTCTELHLDSRRRALHVALDGEVLRLATPLNYRTRPAALAVIAPQEVL